ncbi:LOW QUALITY PROTEIN: ovochymase-1 [Ciconia maguari]
MVGAGLLLLLVSLPALCGLKCGLHPIDLKSPKDALLLGFFSQFVRGRELVPGGQPWQVSLKLGHFHFCGGSLVEDVVITAARCMVNLEQKLLKSLVVTVGERHLQWADRQEQSIPVSRVIIHPTFNQLHYMDCNVALLHLQHPAQYGDEVQPICLPHKDEDFQAGTLCVASGWGKVSEAAGALAPVLQEVELPLIDSSVLLRSVNQPLVGGSVLCTGFPDGGRAACKGDSGGPCMSEDWRHLDSDRCRVLGAAVPSPLLVPAECSSQGVPFFGESSRIQYPQALEDNYPDDSLCTWNITVPEDKIILIYFTKLDVEYQVGCVCDYVFLYLNGRELISKSCGNVFPAPLLAQSHQTTIIFVSDGSDTGRGFELTFMAVHKDSEAGLGCASVAMFMEEGKIDTANYPGLYPRNTKCHWLIEAPAGYVVKLEFEDFAVELSPGCIYDAVTVYGDEEENQLEEAGREDSGLTTALMLPLKDVPLVTPQWLFKCVSGAKEACPRCWPSLRLLGDYQCDGAVISPTSLLTATHCVQLSNKPLHWTVTVGDHDRALRESTEQVRQLKTIAVHPHSDMLSYDSDIAVVQLDVPLEYRLLRPVRLPNSTETLSSSSLCTVSGWGIIEEAAGSRARQLQQTRVPVLENEICERNYSLRHPGGITARMLCAGFVSVGDQDSCQGGSGGPLVCNKENEPFTLYGIVSWGVGCASPKKPGVYSRARIFLDWIILQMKGQKPGNVPRKSQGDELRVVMMHGCHPYRSGRNHPVTGIPHEIRRCHQLPLENCSPIKIHYSA